MARVKAVRVVANGEPGAVVEVQDIDVPAVGLGEVLVDVAAASVNFGDIARCRGGVAAVLAEPPFTLGMDVAGVVAEAGDGMSEWVGRRVVGMAKMSLGGMAEKAIAAPVFDAPEAFDDVTAAAFLLPFHLGYLALHERAALQPGETLLVRSGASAVGTAAIQLGVAAGARVIATAGGADKAKLCASLGAELVIDHTSDDVFDAVVEHTGGVGAHVVFDPIGGEQTEAIWACAALGGRYLPVGFNDDPESGMTGRALRKVSMSNVSVVGVLCAYLDLPPEFRKFGINAFPTEVGRRVHAALLDLIASGAIAPTIGRVIPMSDVAAALEDHAARRTSGRTVVDIAASA